jgi:hypothetical protein
MVDLVIPCYASDKWLMSGIRVRLSHSRVCPSSKAAANSRSFHEKAKPPTRHMSEEGISSSLTSSPVTASTSTRCCREIAPAGSTRQCRQREQLRIRGERYPADPVKNWTDVVGLEQLDVIGLGPPDRHHPPFRGRLTGEHMSAMSLFSIHPCRHTYHEPCSVGHVCQATMGS